MKIAYEDEIGSSIREGSTFLSNRGELPMVLRQALVRFFGRDILLSPPQESALDAGIARRNGKDFLVSAPTNSGKTLVALFRIFTSALEGSRRCVYVVPLKALAEEKAFEFRGIAEGLQQFGGRKIKVSVTTGDYQSNRDFLGSPPPKQGEIVICTPERLEVMLRNPENHEWARAVDTYVFDEFHLLGDFSRGATLETLLTRLLVLGGWPAMVFLSATIGNPEKILAWFQNANRTICHIDSNYRFPKLKRQVLETLDPDKSLEKIVQQMVDDPERSGLVFVASRNDADLLANKWKFQHPNHRFASFHAGLPSSQRNELLAQIRERQIKIVAATTSLKMGVNFPVTDVVIRDAFIRSKRGTFTISASDVTQMMGRAGRGDVPGRALILSRSEELTLERASQLSSGLVETLKPRLIPVRSSHRKKSEVGSELNPISGVVLTQIVVQQTAKVEDIVDFLNHSFSAQQSGFSTWDSRESLDFLLRNHLVEPDEGVDGAFRARPLGKTIACCGISPESGAILAGMLRALMSLQRKAKDNGEKAEDLIARLTTLDFLFLAISTYECRDYWLKKSDVEAMTSIEGYIERLSVDEKPLFNRWRRAEDENYPTRRLLSTLKVEFEDNATVVEKFNRIMATAILLHRHAKGESLGSLSRSYSAGKRMLHEGDLENGLKYTAIWILSCLSKICDPEKAYDMERVKFRILDLIEDVSLGSEMGKLTTKPGIGPKTVRKLIDAGITSVNCLQTGTVEKLKTCGLSKRQIAVLQSKTLRRRR